LFKRYLIAAMLLTSAVSCDTTEDRLAEVEKRARTQAPEIVEETLSAWVAQDREALTEILGQESIANRFLKAFKRAKREGEISTVSVQAAGEPELIEIEPLNEDISVAFDAPYEIEWSSEAASEIVSLTGELSIEYRALDDEWRVSLTPVALWPGIDGAYGFATEYEWFKRGTLKDRHGSVIAKGPAASRRYPFGSVGGTTVGHIGSLTKADVREGADGEVGQLVGASGLEAAFEERLAGLPSSRLTVVDSQGDELETLGEIEGHPGETVKVTLDMELQRAAENAFGSTIGGSVLIQPKTGDLLAVVDSSSFDPNNYVGAEDVEPFNRALFGGYPPGSTMKVVTAAAALETKTVTPDTTLTGPKEYKGVRNFESGEFGSIPFSTAVKFSVNTAFAQVAEDLGGTKLTRFAEAFGFNETPKMSLAARESSFPEPAGLGDVMWASVGQAQVLATPLQMASVVATVGNGGKRMEPRIDMDEPPEGERIMSRKHAGQLAAMMQAAVEGGTGVNARISGVDIAGKTGTAEVDVSGERRNHAWFVCFTPVDGPSVAMSVVSEYGGVGGQVAAPIARRVLLATLNMAR
jgi:cell division protein FtsI/penicillin-binding protein 2/dsDNA-binding SOS-regulon protein